VLGAYLWTRRLGFPVTKKVPKGGCRSPISPHHEHGNGSHWSPFSAERPFRPGVRHPIWDAVKEYVTKCQPAIFYWSTVSLSVGGGL
jgi:hypothetical protein